MEINDITGFIVNACVRIHSNIGPGCFEKVYEEILYYELQKNRIAVERQVLMPIQYESLCIENAYKLDLLVDKKLIVELKSVENITGLHFKQLQTHLKLMNLKNGLLLNFKVDLMKEGIHRVFNNAGR